MRMNTDTLPLLTRGAGRRLATRRSHVRYLQSELNRVGYVIAEDGLFGPRTEAAVESFQRRAGVTVDGSVGEETWQALRRAEDAERLWYPTSYEDWQLNAHRERARTYRTFIIEAAERTRIDPAVLAGLGSRESGWGLFLTPEGPTGTGDHGNGFGLMQIDRRYHVDFIRSGDWKDARLNILYGASYLRNRIERIPAGGLRQLRGGLAAYNASLSRVVRCLETGKNVDSVTTGGDYSKDVLERAGWFQCHGW